MSDFLPPVESKAGSAAQGAERAFYALPATREEAERAYLGTLMLVRPRHGRPTVKVPDSAFSPLRLRLLQAVRAAWPHNDARVASERLHEHLADLPAERRVGEIISCLIQARQPSEIDTVAAHLLRFLGSEA